MQKITMIILFFYFQSFATFSYASVEVSKSDSVTSYKIKGSFISHMGEPSGYINITDKEKLQLKLDSLVQNEPPELVEAYNLLDQTTNLTALEKSEWIEANISYLPGPFLILNSIYLAPNHPNEAVAWYGFGVIRTALDIRRCKDDSLGESFSIIKFILDQRFTAALKDMDERAINNLLIEAIEPAIALYKRMPYNITKPYWIALHSMKVMIAALDNKELSDADLFIAESAWREIEKEYLASALKPRTGK